jgi:hypothetical protein
VNRAVAASKTLTSGTPTATQGTATFATTVFLPGSSRVVANHGGDSNFVSATSATLIQTVDCTSTVSGTHTALVLEPSDKVCLQDAQVAGAVFVRPGGGLVMDHATIRGAIVAETPAFFEMCDMRVKGAVSIIAATGFVLVGDAADDACGGNSIGGALVLENNAAGVEVEANHIGGSLRLSGTSGSGPFAGDARAEIQRNTIGGASCVAALCPPRPTMASPTR